MLNLRSEKGGREREERGEKKEGGGSKKEKRKERLGSVRLQRRTRLFVCVRPSYVEQKRVLRRPMCRTHFFTGGWFFLEDMFNKCLKCSNVNNVRVTCEQSTLV